VFWDSDDELTGFVVTQRNDRFDHPLGGAATTSSKGRSRVFRAIDRDAEGA
jgi:hypothetical protein